MADDRFEMLYCDSTSCRVNSFEVGTGKDELDGRKGLCPGCGRLGHVIATHEPYEG